MEAGGRLKVRSALNPILWLCGIITVPALVAFSVMKEPPGWLVILTFAPVIAAILGFFFLLFFDRDKLQSETYQIRKLELEMVQQKGEIATPATEITIISNPEPRALLAEHKEPRP
jgi:hypothetical protein